MEAEQGIWRGSDYQRKGKNKHIKRDKGEAILKNFVWVNRDLVDKSIGDKFVKGEASLINVVLNQIHWRILEVRNKEQLETQKENKTGSYRQALMGDLTMKEAEANLSNEK